MSSESPTPDSKEWISDREYVVHEADTPTPEREWAVRAEDGKVARSSEEYAKAAATEGGWSLNHIPIEAALTRLGPDAEWEVWTPPTPERVTLTADERAHLRDSGSIGRVNYIEAVEHILTARLTAREQALREEIAGEIEAYADRREKTGAGEWDNEKAEGMSRGRVNGLDTAARIARGGAR